MRQIVKWKTITSFNIYGEPYQDDFPSIIEIHYRGNLIPRILDMPRKEPIYFYDAVKWAEKEYMRCIDVMAVKASKFYLDYFVEWISEMGHHIELTGDEFDSY